MGRKEERFSSHFAGLENITYNRAEKTKGPPPCSSKLRYVDQWWCLCTQAEEKRELQRERGGEEREGEGDEGVMEEDSGSQQLSMVVGDEPPDPEDIDVESETNSVGDDAYEKVSTMPNVIFLRLLFCVMSNCARRSSKSLLLWYLNYFFLPIRVLIRVFLKRLRLHCRM